ncbi:hypothetical protein, partial [Phaeodactylibacter luteus]|uniref:hypothetical protein n=1 Tax=Phaeodactylibacter luteus TaxID=1564516 RepID=UPI001478D2CB
LSVSEPVFGPHILTFDYENLATSYEDSPLIDVCPGTFKFQREWTVFDWCNPGTTDTYTQYIKVGDTDAPVLTCPAGTPLVYSTSPFSCAAS